MKKSAAVGAGTGFMSLLFAEKVGAGGTAIAQDIAPEFLRENYFLEFRKP
jgi:ubiquinone/menaquinone biosynthesis C-methylase UbiE